MKVLYSGRFDPPTPSHIVQILRLYRKYGHVKVVMLGVGRRYPVTYCKQIFNEIFKNYKRIEIMVNITHFGKITKKAVEGYGCNLYVAGNMDVLNHMEKIGVDCEYIERAYDYAASDIPFKSK